MAIERKKYFFCRNGFLLIELILAFALLVTMSTILMMSMMHAVHNQRIYVQQQKALAYAHNGITNWLAHGQLPTDTMLPSPFTISFGITPIENKSFSFIEVTITWKDENNHDQKIVITGGGMRG